MTQEDAALEVAQQQGPTAALVGHQPHLFRVPAYGQVQ